MTQHITVEKNGVIVSGIVGSDQEPTEIADRLERQYYGTVGATTRITDSESIIMCGAFRGPGSPLIIIRWREVETFEALLGQATSDAYARGITAREIG